MTRVRRARLLITALGGAIFGVSLGRFVIDQGLWWVPALVGGLVFVLGLVVERSFRNET